MNIQAYVNIFTGVVNLIFSFPLSKMFGAIGACMSIFIAYIVRAVALNIIYDRVLSFDMRCFAKKCYIRMSCPVLATIAVGVFMNSLIPDAGWMTFLAKGIVITAVYGLFVFIMGFDAFERRTKLGKMKALAKR